MKNIAIIAFLVAGLVIPGCGRRPTPPGAAVSVRPVAARPRLTYERDVAPILARRCLACHSSADPRGGVILDDEGRPDRDTWGRVADALRSGTMPPPGRPGLPEAERTAVVDWLDAEVFRCSSADARPGRVTMRRLNRAEYDHTIRDLFGLDADLGLAQAFPADDVGYGFDNIGDVLTISPILMEKYLRAADLAIDAASRSPRAWAAILDPGLDVVPLGLRKPTYAARSEPVKRIGRPAPPAPEIVDPEALLLRRARDILRGYADRAYRRPATAEELDRLVALVESVRKEGDNFDESIKYAIKAVLISPSFLFHVEEQPDALNDFELAARLSYFLWSSLPDEPLYRLAARGELRQGDNLARHARRMLGDARGRALVDGFVAQWLGLRSLKDATPDPSRFPGFDEPLRRAMIEETKRFAGSIIREDRPVFAFLDADYTYVNERLARHYGLPGVVGDDFRRVNLAGTRRGGVLTHASVLTVTSNPTRTSPVKRGKWILDNILGMPPAPPPAGVEGFAAEGDVGRSETLRQEMERHRADPSCASCHARMDPLGFALENYDAIGTWRADEAGRPIDASGTLPGGARFYGPDGLRSVLLDRREAFARALAEKLLTYAIGRGIGPDDRCFLDAIVRETVRDDARFSTLVRAIVESPPFQQRPQSKDNP